MEIKALPIIGFFLVSFFLIGPFPINVFSRSSDYPSHSRLTAVQSRADLWPMFHNDLTHTGYSASTAPNTNETLWSYQTNGAVGSSPAIAYGDVFVGSNDKEIYALDAYNGSLIWNFTNGGVWSSPAVADGKVYFGSDDHTVYALDAFTGALIWNYNASYAGIDSSPAVADGIVYVGGFQDRLTALNASTGALVCWYPTGVLGSSSPAVDGTNVFVGSIDHSVYAYTTGGTQLWSYRTGGGVQSSPTVAGGKVYIGSRDYNLYALNESTGVKIWSYSINPEFMDSTPAVAYDLVFLTDQVEVLALNASTGTQVWNFSNRLIVGSWNEVGVADGKVFAVGELTFTYNTVITTLNAYTGAPMWQYEMGHYIEPGQGSSPAIANGVVYVGSNDGKLYAFGSNVSTYTVTFTESGLPSGTAWWVDINGDNRSSTSSIITFTLPNGFHTYTAGFVGESASPLTGSVTVNGTPIGVPIVIPEFSPVIIVPLFIVATLAVTVCRFRKKFQR